MKKIGFLCFAGVFALLSAFSFLNQQSAITGVVKDDTGEVLIGASIRIASLNKATITDVNGKYRLEVEPGEYTVECLYTGYATQKITQVKVNKDAETILNFKLTTSTVFEEVVVTSRKAPLIETDYSSKAAGKPASDAGDLSVRGSRSKSRAYYKDEKRLSGEPPAAPATRKAAIPDAAKRDIEFSKKAKSTPVLKTADPSVMEDKTVVPPDGPDVAPSPHAGLLTAGEWNDLHNWNKHWLDLLADGEIKEYQDVYGFYPKNRYTVLLTNDLDFPISDVPVQLKDESGKLIWSAKTDNTGKAELWANLFKNEALSGKLKVEAWIHGLVYTIDNPKIAKEGINRLSVNVLCEAPQNVDIVWAVDATGSMGDEIEYLKTELLDVIGRAKSRNPTLKFQMGTVFYRDQGDEYITKSSGLSTDIEKTVEFIQKQYAGGGGDYPEAVHTALEEAIFGQKWSPYAIARICFLVLDASPHQNPEVNQSLQKSILAAAEKGIRIVPVTASGIQKDTEFLMKFFGLATNGTYVFLTDHSGIGGKHLEPTTDEYKVELLNDLLVRLIGEFTAIETCKGESVIRFDDPQATNPEVMPEAKYFPNPAATQFILDLPVDVQSITLYDAEGKSVRKLEKLNAGKHSIPVQDLPIGFYTIRILYNGTYQSGKILVMRA